MSNLKFTDENDYSELSPKSNSQKSFSDSSDYGPPKKDVYLNMARGMGKGKSFLTGMGLRAKRAQFALEQLNPWATDTEKKDLQKLIDKLRQVERSYTSESNPNASYVKGGEVGADAAGGMIIFTPAAKTSGMRAVVNALTSGAYEGATNTNEDRSAAILSGATGGFLGSLGMDALVKSVAGKMKMFTDSDAIDRRESMERLGLKPRIGDIAGPNDALLIRAGEDAWAQTPRGGWAVAKDTKRLRDIIVPDKRTNENIVTKIMGDDGVGAGVYSRSSDIWSDFEQAISASGTRVNSKGKTTAVGVTNVNPKGLHEALNEIKDSYPQIFSESAIPNKKIREMLVDIAEADPKNLPKYSIQQYHDLRKNLGAVMAKVRLLSTPAAAGAPTSLDERAVGLTEALYAKSGEDIARWGNHGKNQRAFKLFEKANEEWKADILPWKKNPLVHQLSTGPTEFGAPETGRVFTTPDHDSVANLRSLVHKFGSQYDTDLINALSGMHRQSGLLSSPERIGGLQSLSFNSVLGLAPALVSRNRHVQDMFFGDPLLDDGIAELARRLGIGLSRYYGAEEAATIGALSELLGGGDDDDMKSDDPAYQHGVGAANQLGVQR